MIRLREWATRRAGSEYLAPEVPRIVLVGRVYGHPEFHDGMRIETTPIASVNGREITTETGRIYHLDGDPEQAFVKWMSEHGVSYDPERPIAVKRSGQ